jgi:HEAT repeat protein
VRAIREARQRGDVEYLVQAAAREAEPIARSGAIRSLGLLGDRAAVEPLLRIVLNVRDEGTRISAMRALGRIGDDRAAPDLYSLATGDESRFIRTTATATLADLGDRRAIAVFVSFLLNPDPHLTSAMQRRERRWIAGLLRKHRAVEAVGPLGQAWRAGTLRDRLFLHRLTRRLKASSG